MHCPVSMMKQHKGTTLVLLFYNELGPKSEHNVGSLSLSKVPFFQLDLLFLLQYN